MKDVSQPGLNIGPNGNCRDRPDQDRAWTKSLDLETKLRQLIHRMLDHSQFFRREVENQRVEHRLPFDPGSDHLSQEPLIYDSLMGRMLIDQVETFRSFGDDVGSRHLSQHSQYRQRRFRRLWRRFWSDSAPWIWERRSRCIERSILDGRQVAPECTASKMAPSFPCGYGAGRRVGIRVKVAWAPREIALATARSSANFDFGFGRMDIDVDLVGIDQNANQCHRMPANHQERVIRLFQRVHERTALNLAAIHEEHHLLPMRSGDSRRAKPAADTVTPGTRASSSGSMQLDRRAPNIDAENRGRRLDQDRPSRRRKTPTPVDSPA